MSIPGTETASILFSADLSVNFERFESRHEQMMVDEHETLAA